MKLQDKPLAGLISHLRIGRKQEFKNITVFPIYSDVEQKCDYFSLSQALAKNLIEITEVSDSGSVPHLKVKNKSRFRILMADSEELKGAKQNRIVNTSVLLRKESETIIPVSCTEHGRWSYNKPDFEVSGYIAHSELRAKKSRSVSNNLYFSKSFASNQGEVWNDIAEKQQYFKAVSRTGSMEDNYKSIEFDMAAFGKEIKLTQGQKGMLVMINGRVIGMDYVSSERAFQELYLKLLKSYALQAQFRLRNADKIESNEEDAAIFLGLIGAANSEKYKSPGHGWDYRFRSNKITGNALVYKGEVIQFSAFENN